jgi:hypothetical protein
MDEKEVFGEGAASELKIGDIVEWSKWSGEDLQWKRYYGVLIEMKNEIKSNRLVSISKVIPLNNQSVEMEFFTFSLRRVDSTPEANV